MDTRFPPVQGHPKWHHLDTKRWVQCHLPWTGGRKELSPPLRIKVNVEGNPHNLSQPHLEEPVEYRFCVCFQFSFSIFYRTQKTCLAKRRTAFGNFLGNNISFRKHQKDDSKVSWCECNVNVNHKVVTRSNSLTLSHRIRAEDRFYVQNSPPTW